MAVDLDRARVGESTELPAWSQGVAQFGTGLPALVATAGAQWIATHTVGTAKAELFRAVQVAVGPLRTQPGIELEAVAQALQACSVEIELGEPARSARGTPVPDLFLAVAETQASAAVGQIEEVLASPKT